MTPTMYTIVLANQKGGVAKTTSAANLGAALAMRGRRVLLVDLDPQANLSEAFGVDDVRPARSSTTSSGPEATSSHAGRCGPTGPSAPQTSAAKKPSRCPRACT